MLYESGPGVPYLPPPPPPPPYLANSWAPPQGAIAVPPPPPPYLVANGWAPQGYTVSAPPPAPLATPPAPPRGPMPVGTWLRDMGPIHYSIAIKDGHLYLRTAGWLWAVGNR